MTKVVFRAAVYRLSYEPEKNVPCIFPIENKIGTKFRYVGSFFSHKCFCVLAAVS